MSVDYKDMGKRIREFRESKHMTQAALSELAGIEPSNLSHIERAATRVSLPTLMNIANTLEVSLDELVCGSLIRREHIAVRQLNDLLSDCTPDELQGWVGAFEPQALNASSANIQMKISVIDLFQIFAELIRFILDCHAAAEQRTRQFRFFKTIYPALQSTDGFFGNIYRTWSK